MSIEPAVPNPPTGGVRAQEESTRTAPLLFGQTMSFVAGTAVLFTVGAYAGRGLNGVAGIVAFVGAFIALIAMNATSTRSRNGTIALLGAVGLLLGLALAPTLAYYASVNPDAVWHAGGATALFIAGFGAYGYATSRDLAPLARVSSWALLALLVFGIVIIFVNLPGADVLFSVIGLAIFAVYTAWDFQRLRRSSDVDSAPLLAASIFLDILNVFTFFLSLFTGGRD
ncbi:Bax inhibitor-1 family protein [Agromyces seonyuensis]|uniref:Bax inhibitor-1/YccA family protein n=1 Tax=Agromyces seonyuensis TaxID=2662446 RepID=A0A6I4P3N4_9MICO|nr:Bax inhibitor-1 family protein [Agromyces seonyuensis]MWB97844.1 hypothetical protein [Agromyces seonyuensis]